MLCYSTAYKPLQTNKPDYFNITMEFHQSLYKSINLAKSPNTRVKKTLNYRRSQRREIFQKNRIQHPGLLDQSSEINESIKEVEINKENLETKAIDQTTARKEAYIAKFLDWKKKKEAEKFKKNQIKRPFISSCKSNILLSVGETSFAPKNHKFQGPKNIETDKYKFKFRNAPSKEKLCSEEPKLKAKNFININKKLASTPKSLNKKQILRTHNVKTEEYKTKPNPLMASTRITNNVKTNHNKNIEAVVKSENKTKNKKQMNLNEVKTINEIKSGNYVKLKNAQKNVILAAENIKNDNRKHNILINKKNDPNLKFKKLNKITSQIERKIVNPDEKKKMQKKENLIVKSPRKTDIKTVNKPFVETKRFKKPNNLRYEENFNKIDINIKSAQTSQEVKVTKEIVKQDSKSSKFKYLENPKIKVTTETPADNVKPNTSFITSTQKKTSLNSPLGIAPLELTNSDLSPIELEMGDNDKMPLMPLIKLTVNKLSNGNEILDTVSEITNSPFLNETPTKLNDEEKPIFYVSPYVTMSRGKGNKTEKKLRESIYNLGVAGSDGIISAEFRRVKETVRYFRKMVSEEVVRLHNRCMEWEEYKKITDPNILEDCGNDLINVAIGQTKLFTSKKCEHFKTLINQCEEYALKKFELKDFSDIGKPILPEDLEGYWQMMYTQVDDIDARFRKLERWQSNDWKDPDDEEIQEKIKKKNKLLTRISKKKKTQPNNTGIKSKLKELYLGYLQNKKDKLEDNEIECIILTPSSKLKKSVNVKDEYIGTPIRRSKRLSTANENFIEKPNMTPIRRSLRLEAANVSSIRKKDPSTPCSLFEKSLIRVVKTPCIACFNSIAPSPLPRKSILKTPGTQKKKQTVVFSEKLEFNSPTELVKSKNVKKKTSSRKSSIGSEEKGRKRSLNLRARRLIVDPDAKIELPRK